VARQQAGHGKACQWQARGIGPRRFQVKARAQHLGKGILIGHGRTGPIQPILRQKAGGRLAQGLHRLQHGLAKIGGRLGGGMGQFVQQGHGEGAPLHHQLITGLPALAGPGFIFEAQGAAVQQQAAVAVFGQAGELVQAHDLQAGVFQRFEQRVAHPLAELVEGLPAQRRIGVRPAITQRHAV
jgi:hypothetical protein